MPSCTKGLRQSSSKGAKESSSLSVKPKKHSDGTEWYDIEQLEQILKEDPNIIAISLPVGLGPVATQTEAIRHCLDVAKVPYVRIAHRLGDAKFSEKLKELTGQTSAPVIWFNKNEKSKIQDVKPLTTWYDQLVFIDSMRGTGVEPLIPDEGQKKREVLGWLCEILGYGGFQFNIRLMWASLDGPLRDFLMDKYGGPPAEREAVPGKTQRMLDEFDGTIRSNGTGYAVGTQRTAVDVVFAISSTSMVQVSDDIYQPSTWSKDLYTKFPAAFSKLNIPSSIIDYRDNIIKELFNNKLDNFGDQS